MNKYTPVIAASILDADHSNLKSEIESAEMAGVDMFTIDVMDGHFVPRITFGPYVVARIREWTNLPMDVHLMTDKPEDQVQPMFDAGADMITFHIESASNPKSVIDAIRRHGLGVGIALNMETELSVAMPYLEDVDLVNLMAVRTGFGGQPLSQEVLQKVQALRSYCNAKQLETVIEVDGGVKINNVASVISSGASFVTVGTGIYHSTDRNEAVASLKRTIASVEQRFSAFNRSMFLTPRNLAKNRSEQQVERLRQMRDSLDIAPQTWEPMGAVT